MGVKTLFEPGERREVLLAIYRHLLGRASSADLSGPTWKPTLEAALSGSSSPHSIDGNWLLPQVLNARRGTVDSVYAMVPGPIGYQGSLGIWFLNSEDAWSAVKPEERKYSLRDWNVIDAPEMMVYVWTERSRIKGKTALARQADFSTMDRIMQVRHIEWVESTNPVGGMYFKRFDGVKDYVLVDAALVRDLMPMSYPQMMRHHTFRTMQSRFDSRVQTIYESIEAETKRRAQCPIPND